MANKNVTLTDKDNNSLYPTTLESNVYNSNNISLDTTIANINSAIASKASDNNVVHITSFNTSSQTAFGDYIVEKKKLLADTSVRVNFSADSNFTIIYTDANSLLNRTFEVHFNKGQIVRFKWTNSSWGYTFFYTLNFDNSATTTDLQYVQIRSKVYTSDTFTDKQLVAKILRSNSSFTPANITITKIYEIFD